MLNMDESLLSASLDKATSEKITQIRALPFRVSPKSAHMKNVSRYLFLRQLLPIYEILELYLDAEKNPGCTIRLAEDKRCLLLRTDTIKQELESLQKHMPMLIKEKVSKHTRDYTALLRDAIDDRVIFGHFLASLMFDSSDDVYHQLKDDINSIGFDSESNKRIVDAVVAGLDFYEHILQDLEVLRENVQQHDAKIRMFATGGTLAVAAAASAFLTFNLLK